jgi:hypothetical protein
MSHARSFEKIIQLLLVESCCLPVLTCDTDALSPTQRQLYDVNACWNTVYHVIFGFIGWRV